MRSDPLAREQGTPDPRPVKYRSSYAICEGCGGAKAKHAHLCRKCSVLIRGENHYAWKGDAARDRAKRMRARRAYVLDFCERCDKKATERHHVDGDTGNNRPENIMRLCRRCHMEVDGRLSRLKERNRKGRVSARPCKGCDRQSRELKWGYCGACYKRARDAKIGPCRVCGDPNARSIHHLVPRSLGGEHVEPNLTSLCGSGTTGCHGMVEARDPWACSALRKSITTSELSYILATKGLDFLDRYLPRAA